MTLSTVNILDSNEPFISSYLNQTVKHQNEVPTSRALGLKLFFLDSILLETEVSEHKYDDFISIIKNGFALRQTRLIVSVGWLWSVSSDGVLPDASVVGISVKKRISASRTGNTKEIISRGQRHGKARIGQGIWICRSYHHTV